MSMVYKWKGFVPHKISAQIAGDELERIRQKYNGRLLSAHIVTEAKDKESPLHPEFEWNDKKAAHFYRLDQAGSIIRNIVVVNVAANGEQQTVRAFVNVEQDDQRHYTSISMAMGDDELRKQIIEQAWKELVSWRERYKELVEFAKLFAVIEEIDIPEITRDAA